MPLSSDSDARGRQLANLKRTAAVKHGAGSEARIRPLRERYLAELTEALPGAAEQELTIQAHRLAQLELLGGFMDERGVIRHRRQGTVYPAALLMEKLASAFERQHAALMARERDRGDAGETLESIARELTEGAGDE